MFKEQSRILVLARTREKGFEVFGYRERKLRKKLKQLGLLRFAVKAAGHGVMHVFFYL